MTIGNNRNPSRALRLRSLTNYVRKAEPTVVVHILQDDVQHTKHKEKSSHYKMKDVSGWK
ncbi:hypothetical protein E2C01_052599 [Portunus trituberculatus]|uniref:Uncharacterized protein n=1 Tax=Portunus trituberculatus TaxID=210409 RepID=A0A5B7GI41_PORTR|nr:hypothetical protein [Portunus trituberculatus]